MALLITLVIPLQHCSFICFFKVWLHHISVKIMHIVNTLMSFRRTIKLALFEVGNRASQIIRVNFFGEVFLLLKLRSGCHEHLINLFILSSFLFNH